VQALQERLPGSEALHRYDEIACILTGSDKATAGDGVAWVQELCQALRVPSLASYGVTPEDFPVLIKKGSVSSSMQGNPRDAGDSDTGAVGCLCWGSADAGDMPASKKTSVLYGNQALTLRSVCGKIIKETLNIKEIPM
jgi:hypothetical protein